MANVNPMRIPGRWVEGFALDYHTTSSTYLGEDEFGHEGIVPVPPSTERAVQPVKLVSEGLAEELSVPLLAGAVSCSHEATALKNVFDYEERLRLLDGLFAVQADATRGKGILLIDDLYRSGATLNAITQALYAQGGASAVFALTLTRTRSHR